MMMQMIKGCYNRVHQDQVSIQTQSYENRALAAMLFSSAEKTKKKMLGLGRQKTTMTASVYQYAAAGGAMKMQMSLPLAHNDVVGNEGGQRPEDGATGHP
jgi:hypothetical protein